MIFGWKRTKGKPLKGSETTFKAELPSLKTASQKTPGPLCFENVSLPPTIKNLNVQISPKSWVVLSGNDDFAKALFCDLCFSYILPEQGKISGVMKASDVSFLGRSNTTYGNSLLDHLRCGVKDYTKDLLEFVVKNVLSKRFRRHLDNTWPMQFTHQKKSSEMNLDERDILEIAEANLLLQNRKAAVIDTTTDLYQIALEQGFRHSNAFLESQKNIFWIVNDELKYPTDANAKPWDHFKKEKINLYFQNGDLAAHIN